MMNSDVELIANAGRAVLEIRLAREPRVRARRDQPRTWWTHTRWMLATLGLVALRPDEVDPLPRSVRAYAHLTH